MKYQYIFDKQKNLIDVRRPTDIGSPPEGALVIEVTNPTDDQLLHCLEYVPSEDKKNIVISKQKRGKRLFNMLTKQVNEQCERELLGILKENSKEKALIAEINLQAKATRIIGIKTITGKYPPNGEKDLQEISKINEQIKAALKTAKEKKQKLINDLNSDAA